MGGERADGGNCVSDSFLGVRKSLTQKTARGGAFWAKCDVSGGGSASSRSWRPPALSTQMSLVRDTSRPDISWQCLSSMTYAAKCGVPVVDLRQRHRKRFARREGHERYTLTPDMKGSAKSLEVELPGDLRFADHARRRKKVEHRKC
jgi:hypothetical protein